MKKEPKKEMTNIDYSEIKMQEFIERETRIQKMEEMVVDIEIFLAKKFV